MAMREGFDTSLFEVRDVPGKGRGLIALVDIPIGTRILCEKPLLLAKLASYQELEPVLVAKLESMSEVSRQKFLSLHNFYKTKCPSLPLAGIFMTNALPCDTESRGGTGGIYATACLINHSCVPNAYPCWNAVAEHETVHAIRPIAVGTEITISYCDEGPSIARQADLSRSFGFTCTCNACSQPGSLLQANDNRRIQIQSLEKALGDLFRVAVSPDESLADCYSLLRLLTKEFDNNPGILLVRVYYTGFQICIGHGDQARASAFARMAYKALLISVGGDNLETTMMKALARRPADHRFYRMHSEKWHTGRTMIPRNLNAEQFEKWLFRKC